MKPATQALRDTLMYDMAVKAQPRLIAEWEYNRFYAPTVTVTPDQTTTDTDWTNAYDTNSITLPFRPTAGIARLRANAGIAPNFGTARDPGTSRYYPTPDDPRYSYFSSVQRSQLAPASAGDGYEFDAPIKITVDYGSTIACNKIVVGFETGYAKPQSYSIQISPDGNAWQTVYSGSSVDSDGTKTIWHSPIVGSGWGGTGWDGVEAYDSPVVMQAVRLVVYSMNSAYSHADVLQISPRLESDLTPFLVEYSTELSQDSPSFIAPLGKASSNTATVTLSNIDQRFNNENKDSLYYGMIEKKVRFKLDLGIDASAHGGAGLEYVREFTMWADSWGASDNSTVQVSLKDSSVILQEQTMPAILLRDSTVGQIVWTTLDFIGMNNYNYTRSDTDYGQVIPFYWPSDTNEASNPRWGRLMVNTKTPPTTTIWDELSALAEATQTALYFDAYDVLQIKAREAMYNTGKKPDWNLDAVANGRKLPEVVTTSTDHSLTTNQVELTYKPCAMGDDNNGFPRMEVVWTPQAQQSTAIIPALTSSSGSSNTITLLASALTRDLLVGGMDLWVQQPEAKLWSFETDVNIEGEFIHYRGKEYGYYDAAGNFQTKVCYQQTDQDTLDGLNDFLSWKNDYTGRLIVTDRGLYGSVVNNHYVLNGSYSTVLTAWTKDYFGQLGNVWAQQKDGYVTQGTPASSIFNNFQFILSVRQNNMPVFPASATPSVWYGARIRFPGKNAGVPDATAYANWHVGGIHFAGDGNGNGYYLECTTTTQLDGYEKRAWRNEFVLVGLPANGITIQYPGYNANDSDGTSTTNVDGNGNVVTINGTWGNRGYQANVNEDDWNDIDINYVIGADGTDHITVYNKGVVVGAWDIPPNQQPARANNWRFGTFVRGPSGGMDIDYLFAVSDDALNPLQTPDSTNFLDLRSGGYSSGFARTNILYSTGPGMPQPSGNINYQQATDNTHLVYDEFGPVVHEVRTFDESFNDQYVPTYGSYLYLTNPNVVCLRYNSDASGAEFVLANASREIEVVQGEDQNSYGSQNSITWTLSIYGRVVYQAQQDSIKIVKDDLAIRRQGLVRTQFTSRYIQTDEMATAIGEWITTLWGMGVDQVTAELFGNPLLEIGDLVTINYPAKGMSPDTHQYYVTSIKGEFQKGYKNTVTLRRARTV